MQRQALRCRKCKGRFTTYTQDIVAVDSDRGLAEMVPAFQESGEFGGLRFAVEALTSLDDEDDLINSSASTDTTDSNYEITVALEGELDDSQFELPAVAEEPLSSATTAPAAAPAVAGPQPLPPDPRYYNLIDSWTRICFLGVLILGAVSLALIGTFLLRALIEGENVSGSTTVLILAFVGTMAVLLLTFTTTTLNFLLVDLARNTRRLRIHADRSAQVARE